MKTKEEIIEALENMANAEQNFPGMTYENGIEEALRWVLDEISDADFEYADK